LEGLEEDLEVAEEVVVIGEVAEELVVEVVKMIGVSF
jgi:hypothetical protein